MLSPTHLKRCGNGCRSRSPKTSEADHEKKEAARSQDPERLLPQPDPIKEGPAMAKASLAPNRAVAYYRKSTDLQQASIPRQREQVAEYAAKKGYKVEAEYCD